MKKYTKNKSNKTPVQAGSDMSVKEALLYYLMPECDGAERGYVYKRPGKKDDHASVMITFKTNEDLERWRNAGERLFRGFIDMAIRDGDFDD